MPGSRRSGPLSPRYGFLVFLAVCLGFLLGAVTLDRNAVTRLGGGLRQHLGLVHADAATPAGHWNLARNDEPPPELSPEQRREAERLLSLGYAGGSVPGRGAGGVTVNEPALSARGLRFFTSGHAPSACLMDADGRVLHRWNISYDECRRQSGLPEGEWPPGNPEVTGCWRRARLLPDGSVLAIFEGHALVKIDRDSRLIWAYPGRCHHDLDVAPDGSILVLTRAVRLVPEIDPEEPCLLDFITRLSPDGEVLGEIDLLAAFERSVYASCLDKAARGGDIFHTNTVEILDGRAATRLPAFAAGNLLISVRELNTVAVVDPRTEEVVWTLVGLWTAQHQPTLLPDGHLLVFDNLGHHGRSKVIELDPLTQEVLWSYADSDSTPLFSQTCGSCQRLPGGNTLITESDNGRVIEVTPAGDIVWEFRNPRRTGPGDALIAAVLDMECLPEDFPRRWLPALP